MLFVRRLSGARPPATRVVRLASVLGLALLLASAGIILQFMQAPPLARAASPHIDAITFNGDVDPASAHFTTDALDTAQHDGATMVLITLDTPGGDLDSMKTIVQKELASSIPIVVYVSPQGARAASAGMFIALAASVVAMAPNTRIGAASPIDSSGNNLPATLDTKIKNDLLAQVRANQATFGRNAVPAEQAINSAASFDDQEAIQNKLANLSAASQANLLAQLNGYPAILANGQNVTLQTAGLPAQTIEPTIANQLEGVLLDPTLLFILFIVAAICIYLELAHPGAIVPGTVGAIALVLFLFGAGSIAPNWTGLVLMLLAIVLLAVDVRVPTHGVLTLGALISLVVGSLIFFDSGASEGAPTVNPIIIFAFAIGVGLVSLIVIRYAIASRHGRYKSGSDALIGQTATVIEPLGPTGRVNVLGENWAAVLSPLFAQSSTTIPIEQPVRVVSRDGLTLIVEPLHLLPS